MANLTTWYDEVLAQAPGCPVALADWAIRDAAIEFCDRSRAHVVDLAAINAVAATADYALTPPANTEIVTVLDVAYDGDAIRPIGPQDAIRFYGDDWKDLQRLPERYMTQYGTSLKLVPKPDASLTGGIVVTVALRPTAGASAVDDAIAVPYKRAIAKGARKTLWLMPKKPWTQFERGKKEEEDFIAECAIAHVLAEKGRASSPIRSRNYYDPRD